MKKLELNEMEKLTGGGRGNRVDCIIGTGGIMLAAVTFCIFPPAGALAIGLAAGGFGVGMAGMVRGCGY